MLFLRDIVEELTTSAVLEHKEATFTPFPDFVKFDNVWMFKFFENVDFVDEGLVVLYTPFLDDFDSKLLFSLSVFGQVHLTKSTVGELGLEVIGFFDLTFV